MPKPTCWDWLTLAVVVQELIRTSNDPACQSVQTVLRTVISLAESSNSSYNYGVAYLSAPPYDGLAYPQPKYRVSVAAKNLRREVLATIQWERKGPDGLGDDFVQVRFPMSDVLACLDQLETSVGADSTARKVVGEGP
jgi:hypothetical protein